MVGATLGVRLNFSRSKKNKVKTILEFLKKYKKFKTRVIESIGFNKFSQFNNIKYRVNLGEYPKPGFQNHKLCNLRLELRNSIPNQFNVEEKSCKKKKLFQNTCPSK